MTDIISRSIQVTQRVLRPSNEAAVSAWGYCGSLLRHMARRSLRQLFAFVCVTSCVQRGSIWVAGNCRLLGSGNLLHCFWPTSN